MTEEEWLTCEDPRKMLEFSHSSVSDRRLRLFAVACCRRKWKYFTDERLRRVVETGERFAEDEGTLGDLDYAAQEARSAFYELRSKHGSQAVLVRISSACLGLVRSRLDLWQVTTNTSGIPVNSARARTLDGIQQCELLREIFGNPFRPVAFNAAWRTSDVMLLAEGIYAERAFDRMPILADALQDAGCDSDALLNHLRDASVTHVRGCWALDLVLGKE
jgi:hypothetical protein